MRLGRPVQNHGLYPNPQLEVRGFFQTMEHPYTGKTRYASFPAAFSAFERDLHYSPPPTLGQHNREVLQSELGITEAELKRLETTGIIGNRPSFID
jgi:crotonobetainyl-CoA:carnitine CoA-transferase CaiB-like acyl-CoA transferase